MFTLSILERQNTVLNDGVDVPDDLNWVPSKQLQGKLKSKNYTCECCGLVSRPHKDYPSGFIELVRFSSGREVAMCSMCVQGIALDRKVVGQKEHGYIIRCPELSQGEVVHMARLFYLGQILDNKISEEAERLIELMQSQLTKDVSTIIPSYEDGSIEEFVDIYKYLPPTFEFEKSTPEDDESKPSNKKGSKKVSTSASTKKKLSKNEFLKDLRYLPKQSAFDRQIRFWNLASYKSLSVD